jgi:uncharacterized protein (DUF2062 family)
LIVRVTLTALVGFGGISVRFVLATMSFLLVFGSCFIVGGWFLMPYLPPTPDHPISAFEVQYWTTNWAGAVLGLILGAVVARSQLKNGQRIGRRK